MNALLRRRGMMETMKKEESEMFTVQPVRDVSVQNPCEALQSILDAVKAAKGDIPFYAWSAEFRGYKPMGVYYIPARYCNAITAGVGWYGFIQRPENNNAQHVIATILAGFDPVAGGPYTKMVTSGRSISLRTTDVFKCVDLTELFSDMQTVED